MEVGAVVGGWRPPVDGWEAGGHVVWVARAFGRPELAPFTPGDVEALAQTLRARRVEAGTRILSPGEPADAAFIVQRGEVGLSTRWGRRRRLVAIQRPGGVFGDVPLLCGLAFPYAAVARSDATLLVIERARLLDLLGSHPAVALRWLSSVVRRLDAANRRIVALTVGDLRSRTLALLADELLVDGAAPEAAGVDLTQAEVAALLGATRQSVNRVLAGLAGEGLVRPGYGRIEVLDERRLLELAGPATVAHSCC